MFDADPSLPPMIPHPRTRLIGREVELGAVGAFLLDEAVPLLTLTGPGGVGKTRLALEIAKVVRAQFADGACWVDLTALDSDHAVLVSVVSALGIASSSHQHLLPALSRYLSSRQLLLVLDNCEHVLAGVGDLAAALLAVCPALQILATSRAPLHLRGEQVFPVAPLPLPQATASEDDIVNNPAVQLFVTRAQAVRPEFALSATSVWPTAALCRTLDGLPLAIELAAARSATLSPEALLAQMTDRLVLLSDGPRDAPIRQQTMEAAIAWSYNLLSPAEQALMRALAVFAGGFTLDAMHGLAVTNAATRHEEVSQLSALVRQSLIQREAGDGEPRFLMLETIRAFALRQLRAAGDEDRCRERHAAWFRDSIISQEIRNAIVLPNSAALLDRLVADHANLQGALGWMRASGDVAGLLALAAELVSYWYLGGHLREGCDWLESGLAHAEDVPPDIVAHAQFALSVLVRHQHDRARALDLCQASLRHYRAQGDTARIARAAAHAARTSLDVTSLDSTDAFLSEARVAFAEHADAPWAQPLGHQLRLLPAIIAKNRGDVALANTLLESLLTELRHCVRTSRTSEAVTCWPLFVWGATAHLSGDVPLAFERYQASLDVAWRHHDAQCVAYAVTRIASLLAADGRWREAAWLLGAAEAYSDQIGLDFTHDVWNLTRAFGVPEPWQGPEEYTGQARAIRSTVLRRGPKTTPPILEPATAQTLWSAGHNGSIAEAVRHALDARRDVVPPAPFLAVSARPPIPPDVGLTPRQQEILALLCHRLTDPEIAERLFLSPRTVEGHVTQILGKIGAANRREAAALAMRHALV